MIRYRIVLFLYLIDISCLQTKTVHRNSLNAVWKDLVVHYIDNKSQNDLSCPSCSQIRSYIENKHMDVNITNIRIEIAKKEILGKLGLTGPPTAKYNESLLPLPVIHGTLIKTKAEKYDKIQRHRVNTERVLLIPSELNCTIGNNGVELKLTIDTPEQLRGAKVFTAKLWLYMSEKIKTEKNVNNCFLTSKPCNSFASEIRKHVLSLDSLNYKDDWIEKDISWWLQEHTLSGCYHLNLVCSSHPQPQPQPVTCSFLQEAHNKPFVVVDFKPALPSDVFREKRNINCLEGATECCRETLYISFSDIGWGDWIIQPKGYQAYYCKGTCANVASISLSGTSYHSVLKKLILTHGNDVHFVPCCTPTRLSPVQLIYINQNGTLIQKIIPDLTVDSCGCM